MKLGVSPLKCPHCDKWVRSPEDAKKANRRALIFSIKFAGIITVIMVSLVVIFGGYADTSRAAATGYIDVDIVSYYTSDIGYLLVWIYEDMDMYNLSTDPLYIKHISNADLELLRILDFYNISAFISFHTGVSQDGVECQFIDSIIVHETIPEDGRGV